MLGEVGEVLAQKVRNIPDKPGDYDLKKVSKASSEGEPIFADGGDSPGWPGKGHVHCSVWASCSNLSCRGKAELGGGAMVMRVKYEWCEN